MSEYANRHDRARLVGLVFFMQALGLIIGPLVALALLEAHVGSELTWRLLLGLGALPALGVIHLRSKSPSPPLPVDSAGPRFSSGVLIRSGKPRSIPEFLV